MTIDTEITTEMQTEMQGKTQDMLSQAREMTIATEMQNTQAETFTANLKAEIKRRKKLLEPTKDALDASKKAYQGLVAQIVTPLEEITELVGGKISGFLKMEFARRAELQRIEDQRVADLQRKEDARVAALQAKEEARVREAQRKADEKYAAQVKAEKEVAEAAGREAAAIAPPAVIEARIVAAPIIIAPRIVAAVTAAAGTTHTMYWSAKVTDIKALCAAVVAGTVDDIFVQGNMPALNGHAKIKKIEGQILPGVIGVMTPGTSQRSA